MTSGLTPLTAADWDAAYRFGDPVWDEPPPATLLELARRFTPPPATVLDAGCGTGTTARALAALGYQVLGVDHSAVAIELARAHPRNDCTFIRLDLLADRVDPVDLVLDRGLLHARCNPDAQRQLVEALAADCRPHGHWLHVGARAETESTFHRMGPSALTDRDFAALVESWFEIVHSQAQPYGDNPGETDFAARFAVLRRRPGS